MRVVEVAVDRAGVEDGNLADDGLLVDGPGLVEEVGVEPHLDVG